jgi:hypothetical protein
VEDDKGKDESVNWAKQICDDFDFGDHKIQDIRTLSRQMGQDFDFKTLHSRLKRIRGAYNPQFWPTWAYFLFTGVNHELITKMVHSFHTGPTTALIYAALGRELNIVKQFAPERVKTAQENEHVQFAAGCGSIDITDYLLKNHYKLGLSALRYAVEYGRADIADILIRVSQICPEVRDKDGLNMLDVAVLSLNDACIKMFIGQCGMEPSKKNLQLALKQKQVDEQADFLLAEEREYRAFASQRCIALLDPKQQYPGLLAENGFRKIYKLLNSGEVKVEEYLADLENFFAVLSNGVKRDKLGPSPFNSRGTFRDQIAKCEVLREETSPQAARKYFMEAVRLFIREECDLNRANVNNLCFKLSQMIAQYEKTELFKETEKVEVVRTHTSKEVEKVERAVVKVSQVIEEVKVEVELKLLKPYKTKPRAFFYTPREAAALNKEMRRGNVSAQPDEKDRENIAYLNQMHPL